jgi:hypothetical protein
LQTITTFSILDSRPAAVGSPFGMAAAAPEPSAAAPSAASPTTAYLRLFIKLLLGVFPQRHDNWKVAWTDKSNDQECGFLLQNSPRLQRHADQQRWGHGGRN